MKHKAHLAAEIPLIAGPALETDRTLVTSPAHAADHATVDHSPLVVFGTAHWVATKTGHPMSLPWGLIAPL